MAIFWFNHFDNMVFVLNQTEGAKKIKNIHGQIEQVCLHMIQKIFYHWNNIPRELFFQLFFLFLPLSLCRCLSFMRILSLPLFL